MHYQEIRNGNVAIESSFYEILRNVYLPEGKKIVNFVTNKGWFSPEQQWFWYPTWNGKHYVGHESVQVGDGCLIDTQNSSISHPYVGVDIHDGLLDVGFFAQMQPSETDFSEVVLRFRKQAIPYITNISLDLSVVEFRYNYQNHGIPQMLFVQENHHTHQGVMYLGVKTTDIFNLTELARFSPSSLDVKTNQWPAFLPTADKLSVINRDWAYSVMPHFLPGGSLETINNIDDFQKAVFGLF